MISLRNTLIITTLLAAAVFCSGCSKDGTSYPISDFPVKDDGTGGGSGTGGEATLKSAPYPIGCAITPNNLSGNANYRNLILSEFSSISAENAMKMDRIVKGGTYDADTKTWTLQYDWTDVDLIVNFAQANNIRVHGHTLVWYKETSYPDFILAYDKNGDVDCWKNFLKTFITDVVGRYKGRIESWDVVNEAVSNDGSGMRSVNDDIWRRNIGEDYIALAFRYAEEADPDCLLFYNDYGMEWGPTKRGAVCRLVAGLKDQGVPIDGIGLQTHTNINQSASNIAAAITAAYECGMMVHVSELDVNLYPEITFDSNGSAQIPSGITPTASDSERLQKQADVYKAVADALKAIPEDYVYGITTWGLIDNSAYQNYYPLLFDNSYQPKPAYYSLTAAF